MDLDDETIIKYLNELEIRFVTGNLSNYDFNANFNFLQIHSSNELFRALEFVAKSAFCHDYGVILNANLTDLGLHNVSFDPENPKSLECKFIAVDDEKLSKYVKQVIILFIGISALQQFVKANVCGPEVGNESNYSLFTSMFSENVTQEYVIQFLSRDGELPISNIVQLKLLFFSNMFLSHVIETDDLCLTRQWWLMRCLMMHQHVLAERIASLHDEMALIVKKYLEVNWIINKVHPVAELIFYVECAQMHLHYHEVQLAKKNISLAQNLVGLSVELTGAYGKRTRFQNRAVAQLLVKLVKDNEKSSVNIFEIKENSDLPPDLNLQDDTLLNKISFINSEEYQIEYLLPEEQVVLLGHCLLVQRSGAFTELLREEVMSYINCLLEQPKIWSIYLKLLIMRCKLEKESSRHVERSLMQLESVIDSIKKGNPSFSVRFPMLYAVAFPMLWVLEKELADLWMSMGATKTALVIYEKLQLWQEIVQCYFQLGRTSCAETLLRNQLKVKETPLLYSLLGDVLDDPEMYHKADELAKGKNARCQRSLAYYYFKRKLYEKSLPFFQRTLEINPLQSSVWFSYGFAALQCKDYLLSAKAYRQVVLLDPDNFEAWNNLSNAYIRSQQKERAWRSLQEALKCNYEEWRVWENFLAVSTDIGVFDDVIRAWHRLLDIKGKHQDSEVLGILVQAINEDIPDFYGHSASKWRKLALQLLGRLSSISSTDYTIWNAYSALLCPDPNLENDLEVLSRSVLYQQKALRYSTQIDRWESNLEHFKVILKIAVRLCNLSLVYLKQLDATTKNQQKSAIKLALQSVIVKAQKNLYPYESCDKIELESNLDQLKNMLNEMLNF
ncbi:tetratricopeptide repeat protein 27-like [Argiope bruennichi]|uniref:Tetratricopeptide repeat protein 27 like protein n=1 Tax=Argiope bruennichi TaxID=94029 RepID=A0A8T0EAE2_ARGBR|nr:tetratricopeptide repeat protein 27-like [Argiope bruennichi]KAF8768454.1 Tetratricopeptide repeat protein 27 like protein [Argiope bruennichi]